MSEKWPHIFLLAEPRVANCSVELALKWWEISFANRSPADGKMIYIEGRFHEDDELGHIMSDGSGDWSHLVLPL